MMAKAGVYYNNKLAGYLEKKSADDYRYVYDENYLQDRANPSISVTLLKSKTEYQSKELFAFFHGLLSEGINKEIQCRLLKIDENDEFTRLLKTAGSDTIGAITIKEIKE
jgi:HipA-like protein